MLKHTKLFLTALHVHAPLHKWRRNQSAAYHNRIQKKWNKRTLTDPDFCANRIITGARHRHLLNTLIQLALAR